MKTNSVIDISNLTHVVRHSLFKKNDTFSKSLLIGAVISLVINVSKKYKVDGILIAGDSKNVWRKDIYADYKGNRKDLRDEYHHLVIECMVELQDFFNNYTNIPYISADRAEADDIIAVACQINKHGNVIMSSDKDFIQLLDEKTKLYAPTLKQERSSDDAQFDLFVKCIRGDMGDNIFSAYPRVRIKVLEEAWIDPYKMTNVLEATRKDGQVVKNVYNLNRELIDLTRQPNVVRTDIISALNGIGSGNYNHVNILRFLGEHGLKEMAKELDINTLKMSYIFEV
jgi:hypothetical protein